MKGTIVFCNPGHGRYAAETETGDFVGFELMDSIDLATGMTIIGNLDACGREIFCTEGGERFSVFMEITGGTRVSALTWAMR